MLQTDLANFQMHSPIHVPAGVAAVHTQRPLFAQAHSFDPVFGNSRIH
jgi:hypothetical protein